MTRNLERRLRQLEERLQPESELMVIQVVFVGSDGSRKDGPQIQVRGTAPAVPKRRR
jgi:hypothetical protein